MDFTSLPDILRTHARDRADHRALVSRTRSWSYRELYEEAARVAQALIAEGVEPRGRVAVLDKNTGEYFAVLFGAAMAHVVTLAVNWRLAPREMEYIVDHAQATVLFVGEEFLPHVAQMSLPQVRRIVVFGRPGAAGQVGYREWQIGRAARDPDLACDPDETCYQLYTSGTTGLPKGVELTHRNFLTAMEVGAKEWALDGDSVT